MVAFEAWTVLGALALVFMLTWAVAERRITLMTLLSGVLWAWWGFQATSVRYHREAVTVEESYPALVYVGAFLSLVSFLALVLHRLEQFPPDPETDADTEATTT